MNIQNNLVDILIQKVIVNIMNLHDVFHLISIVKIISEKYQYQQRQSQTAGIDI